MSGDINWSSVVFATHLDGADGSTSIVDAKGHSVTAGGGLQISTASAKFGGASAYFNGADAYIGIADSGAFNFAGDFTIEFQANGDIVGKCLLSNTSGTYLYNNALNVNGAPIVTDLNLSSSSGGFRHYEISRAGTTLRVFEDGVLKGSGSLSGTANFTGLVFGKYAPNGNLWFSGYVDEVRITGGVARHTSAFTPPTAEFDFFAPAYDGVGSVTIQVQASGVGQYKALGIADVTVHVIGNGSGALTYSGTALVNLTSLRGSADGTHPFYAEGGVALALYGDGEGWFAVYGEATARVKLSTQASGVFPLTGRTAAKLAFRGLGAGNVPSAGDGFGRVPFAGFADGHQATLGSAASSLTFQAHAVGAV